MTQKQIYDYSKEKSPYAIAMMRIGDFYEVISDDAITCADILGITLTRRKEKDGSTLELAGFPHHALETYLPKLVRAGKRVAIYDNIDDLDKKFLIGEDYEKAKQLIKDAFKDSGNALRPIALGDMEIGDNKVFVRNLIVAKPSEREILILVHNFDNASFGISASGHPFAALGSSKIDTSIVAQSTFEKSLEKIKEFYADTKLEWL